MVSGLNKDIVEEKLKGFYSFESKEFKKIKSKGVYYMGLPKNTKTIYYEKLRENVLSRPIRYNVIKGDHVMLRYELLEVIGSGCSGDVVKAKDHRLDIDVALKIFNLDLKADDDMYENETRFLRIINATYRSRSSNIVELLDNFKFRDRCFVVFELLGPPISSIIGQTTPTLKMKTILREITKGLVLLSEMKVIHGDIKPANVLFTNIEDPLLKIADFGGSCFDHDGHIKCHTLHYIPPEGLLKLKCTVDFDTWALGIMIIELITGINPFRGSDKADQMNLYIEALGQPPYDMVTNSPVKNRFFRENLHPIYCTNEDGSLKGEETILRAYPGSRSLAKILTNFNDKSGLDFVTRCLIWTPSDRITRIEMLKHPWLAEIGKPEEKQDETGTETLPEFFIRMLLGSCMNMPAPSEA